MGMKFSLTDAHGALHPEAYARVCGFSYDDRGAGGRITLAVYHNQVAMEAGLPAMPGEEIGIVLSAEGSDEVDPFDAVIAASEAHSPKKVAYALAGKQKKLKDAVDVLEDGQVKLSLSDVGLAELPKKE